MLTERRDRVWFSHLLQHPARKWSVSILTTPEPALGYLWKGSITVVQCRDHNRKMMALIKHF